MTLIEIKRHPSFPFRDFVTNDLSFLLLELYWAELFRSVLQDAGYPAQDWVPLFPADRLDGNPILFLINRTLHPFRELRIIQHFNTDHFPELNLEQLAPVHFTDGVHNPFIPSLSYEKTDDDGVTPADELVLFSDISEACERLNRDFIRKWCVECVSVDSMQQTLRTYWTYIKQYLIDESPEG